MASSFKGAHLRTRGVMLQCSRSKETLNNWQESPNNSLLIGVLKRKVIQMSKEVGKVTYDGHSDVNAHAIVDKFDSYKKCDKVDNEPLAEQIEQIVSLQALGVVPVTAGDGFGSPGFQDDTKAAACEPTLDYKSNSDPPASDFLTYPMQDIANLDSASDSSSDLSQMSDSPNNSTNTEQDSPTDRTSTMPHFPTSTSVVPDFFTDSTKTISPLIVSVPCQTIAPIVQVPCHAHPVPQTVPMPCQTFPPFVSVQYQTHQPAQAIILYQTLPPSVLWVCQTVPPSVPLVYHAFQLSVPLVCQTLQPSVPLVYHALPPSMPLVCQILPPSVPLMTEAFPPSLPLVCQTPPPTVPLVSQTLPPTVSVLCQTSPDCASAELNLLTDRVSAMPDSFTDSTVAMLDFPTDGSMPDSSMNSINDGPDTPTMVISEFPSITMSDSSKSALADSGLLVLQNPVCHDRNIPDEIICTFSVQTTPGETSSTCHVQTRSEPQFEVDADSVAPVIYPSVLKTTHDNACHTNVKAASHHTLKTSDPPNLSKTSDPPARIAKSAYPPGITKTVCDPQFKTDSFNLPLPFCASPLETAPIRNSHSLPVKIAADLPIKTDPSATAAGNAPFRSASVSCLEASEYKVPPSKPADAMPVASSHSCHSPRTIRRKKNKEKGTSVCCAIQALSCRWLFTGFVLLVSCPCGGSQPPLSKSCLDFLARRHDGTQHCPTLLSSTDISDVNEACCTNDPNSTFHCEEANQMIEAGCLKNVLVPAGHSRALIRHENGSLEQIIHQCKDFEYQPFPRNSSEITFSTCEKRTECLYNKENYCFGNATRDDQCQCRTGFQPEPFTDACLHFNGHQTCSCVSLSCSQGFEPMPLPPTLYACMDDAGSTQGHVEDLYKCRREEKSSTASYATSTAQDLTSMPASDPPSTSDPTTSIPEDDHIAEIVGGIAAAFLAIVVIVVIVICLCRKIINPRQVCSLWLRRCRCRKYASHQNDNGNAIPNAGNEVAINLNESEITQQYVENGSEEERAPCLEIQ